MSRLLVVEDDETIGSVLESSLRAHGHQVGWQRTGREALRAAAGTDFDLVLLDLGLPDLDGVEVCRRARAEHPRLAILVLTARSSELDEVSGLDAGADDYLTKPFSLSVLTARVRALLRRGDAGGEREVAGVRVDTGARRAWRDGRELELSPKEFDLLAPLVGRAGEAVARDEIMSAVWDENWWGSTKTLDTHVGWLRRKLGEPPVLTTVRGVGFRFEAG
jgi:DNA-binding response OmpR family regulator